MLVVFFTLVRKQTQSSFDLVLEGQEWEDVEGVLGEETLFLKQAKKERGKEIFKRQAPQESTIKQ